MSPGSFDPRPAARPLPKLLASLLAAALAVLVALYWRHYRPQLALATGLAVGALVFVTWRTVERMRSVLRR